MPKLAIDFKQVSYKYPGVDEWTLKDVNLKIPRNSFYIIAGPVGSGKTTLLMLARGFHKEYGGKFYGDIHVLGKNIGDLDIHHLGSKVGIIFQNPALQLHQLRVIDEVMSAPFIVLISFGVLFAMTTNPIEIPMGLMKSRIPHKYGITVMVGYRMLPLISQRIGKVMDAQRARGGEISFSLRNFKGFVTRLISLMVPILHSTLESSVKLSETLISRGYNPNGKITLPPSRFKKNDYVLLAVSVLILLAILSI